MKRILVTGANKGIGLAITKKVLADHSDSFVFLGSRSLERGKMAVDSILKDNPEFDGRVEVKRSRAFIVATQKMISV